jgi:hypothetical protein
MDFEEHGVANLPRLAPPVATAYTASEQSYGDTEKRGRI